jgi:hypothetical protein
MLRDDNLGTAFVDGCNDRVAVECLVPEQRTKIYSLDERLNANSVKALSWQQDKADQIAECIGQGQEFGGHSSFGAAYGLIFSPPFAPCP